jgi:murein DD-endopeptidase MepM/ murein hydrolase activator NlpD
MRKPNRAMIPLILVLSIWLTIIPSTQTHSYAANKEESSRSTSSLPPVPQLRQALFEQMSAITSIPWTRIAAIDQYERTMTIANKKSRLARDGPVSIIFSEVQWAGALNPNPGEQHPKTIALFGGIGKDGDGDGLADRNNDLDVLYTMVQQILPYGTSPEDFKIALWETYHNSRAVERILQFERIYSAFDTLALDQHAFPVPLRSEYSYRGTWGASRGWGGRRIHEGTDIFAGHGVPVRSTCYGIVEIKGWNRYGGWRIGIRSINNVYHYYAHLSGFNKEVYRGKVVSPGETIGWVGSSGYGKQGTSGKFPPHLHYGLYRDSGYTDWPFDPYTYLRRWEREEAGRRSR